MTKDETRLALEPIDKEHEEVSRLLDELTFCGECGKDTKEGADAGCPHCIARDVMNK